MENTITLETPVLAYPEAYEAIFKDVFDQQLKLSVSFSEIKAQWRITEALLKKTSKLDVYEEQ